MKRRSPWYLFAVAGDEWKQLEELSVRHGRALRRAGNQQRFFNGTLVIAQLDYEGRVDRSTAERPRVPISNDQIAEIQQRRNREQLALATRPTRKAR